MIRMKDHGKFALIAVGLVLAVLISTRVNADRFDGQKLRYQFSWKGMVVAEGKVSISTSSYKGISAYRIVFLITSQSILDKIWPVRDRFDIYTRPQSFRTLNYSFFQREGKYAMNTTVEYDSSSNSLLALREKVSYEQPGGELRLKKKPQVIPAGELLDPISAIFFLRNCEMSPGKSYTIKVFDGRRIHLLQYTIGLKEEIETQLGKLEAYKVTPKILSSSDDDKNSKVNKVYKVNIWVSADATQDIVLITSDMFWGKVQAELVSR